jgi:hypothetical protein
MSVNTVGGRQSTVHSVGTSADLPSFDSAIASFKDRIHALDNAEVARKVLEGLGRFNTQSVIDPTEGIFIYFEGLDMPEEIIDSLGGLDSYVKGQSAYEAIKSLKIDIRNFTREFMEHVQATFQSYEELFAFAEQLQASGQKEKAVRALYAAAIKVLGEASKDKLTAAVTKIEELDPNMLSLDLQQRINLRAQMVIVQLSQQLVAVKEELAVTKQSLRHLQEAEASRRVYEEKLREIRDGYGFGPENWKKYFGDVGAAPPLPAGIEAILEGPCPFHKGKKVKDTHLLALVPATVNGRPFKLDLLAELVQRPNTALNIPSDRELQSQSQSQWILLTRDIIPDSNNKSFTQQETLIKKNYRVLKELEIATASLVHSIREGKGFFDEEVVCTRCEEVVTRNGIKERIVVGGIFSADIFNLETTEEPDEEIGLAVAWDFGGSAEKFRTMTRNLRTAERKIEKAATDLAFLEGVKRAEEAKLREIGDEYGFGPENWAKYFGDIGVVPPLPTRIESVLEGPCPFHDGRKVKDTHLLVLVPATVDGRPFTLDLLQTLITEPKNGGYASEYGTYWPLAKQEIGPRPAFHSQWVLMTKEVVPGTGEKCWDDQEETLGNSHIAPTVLQAATCILMHYTKTGQRLYHRDPQSQGIDERVDTGVHHILHTRTNSKIGEDVALVGLSLPGKLTIQATHPTHCMKGIALGGVWNSSLLN